MNNFLKRLDQTLDWRPIEKASQAMYPVTMECATARKMSAANTNLSL